MPVPPKHADLEIYFQCRIIGCMARCAVSPKQSGRLGDHWREKHVIEHGPFNGREVLVKTRNADGTFATQSFDSYATANGIVYKTQKSPRPSRHVNTVTPTLKSTFTTRPRAAMDINSSLPAIPTLTPTTATATTINHPTSNLRRIDRMQRQLRIASMPSRLQAYEPTDRDTLDSHPDQPIAPPRPKQRAVSMRLPLKRNLSQAFSDAKSSPTQATSSPYVEVNSTATTNANTVFGFASAPAATRALAPKTPFSQSLISHLRPIPIPTSPYNLIPPPRTALSATQALRGTLNHQPLSHVTNRNNNNNNTSQAGAKDYSLNTWSCEMCHKDFADLRSVTRHLRDYHGVERDVVWCTPERDVITMVLASVRIEDGEHGWVDFDVGDVNGDVDGGDDAGSSDDADASRRGKMGKGNIKRNTKQGTIKSEEQDDPDETETDEEL